MLVPKQLGEIARVVSNDPTRGALKAVHLERDEKGKPYAVGVDGKQMVVLTWLEPPVVGEWPEEDVERVNGFEVNIDGTVLSEFTKQIPSKKGMNEVLQHGLVDENPNGTIHLKSQDGHIVRSLECKPVLDRFPSWRDVIPEYNRVDSHELALVVQNSEEEDIDFDKMALSILVNPDLLKGLAEVMSRMVPDSRFNEIRLVVPFQYGNPLLLERLDSSRSRGAVGVLMPIRDSKESVESPLSAVKSPEEIECQKILDRVIEYQGMVYEASEKAIENMQPGDRVIAYIGPDGKRACWTRVSAHHDFNSARDGLRQFLEEAYKEYYVPQFGDTVTLDEFELVVLAEKEAKAPEPEPVAEETAETPLVDDEVLEKASELNVNTSNVEMLAKVARDKEHLLTLIRSFAA